MHTLPVLEMWQYLFLENEIDVTESHKVRNKSVVIRKEYVVIKLMLMNSLLIQVSQNDCYAHSAEFTPGANTVRPLTIQTDTWCSSGEFRNIYDIIPD